MQFFEWSDEARLEPAAIGGHYGGHSIAQLGTMRRVNIVAGSNPGCLKNLSK
jgi:hypothetical protein